MEFTHWESKWKTNDTPWANSDVVGAFEPVYKWLRSAGYIDPSTAVLIPLSGDTPVARFLYDEGHPITCIEFVREAATKMIDDLFPDISLEQSDTRFQGERLEIRIENFFDVALDTPFPFVFDRGSLVAVTPAQRKAYVAQIKKCIEPGSLMHLSSFVTDNPWTDTAPFPFTPGELMALYDDFIIRRCDFHKTQCEVEHLLAKGVTSWQTERYVLQYVAS